MMYNKQRSKILFIGDNFEKVGDIAKRLDEHGYEVMFALGGPAGIRAAKIERPDAILCDLGLYDLKGLNVCRELKADLKTSDAGFIFFTKSFHNKESIATALSCGADDCLPETSSVEIIAAKIDWLVARKKQELEQHIKFQILRSRQTQIAEIFRSVMRQERFDGSSHRFSIDTTVAIPSLTGTTEANVIASIADLLDEQTKALDSIETENDPENTPGPVRMSVNVPITPDQNTTNFEFVM